MTITTTNRFANLLSDLPTFGVENPEPVKFASEALDLSGKARAIEAHARKIILDNVPQLGDVRVSLEIQYWKGGIENAKSFMFGGRVRVKEKGLRPSTRDISCPDVTILGAKITDAEAFALDLFESIVILRGLCRGVAVTCKEGKARAQNHWAEPAEEFGIEYISQPGKRDAFQRGQGTFGDVSALVERFGLTNAPKTVRTYLPRGNSWADEVRRIIANRVPSIQTHVSCLCSECLAEAPGEKEKDRKDNATRRIPIALLRMDPMSGACRHRNSFRVVERPNGKFEAEQITLEEACREADEREAAAREAAAREAAA